jgi:16S rRNA (guanine966-N2)-methyltransferase
MRIIAGTARSLPLKTIEGLETRPTTDKIKETLFNMLQNDVPGCYFLDLFAGSGQIGLEAISRGALYAVFIENNRKAAKCIEDNIAFTKFTKESRLLTTDVISGISSLEGKYTFDIIFMDPPYDKGLEKDVLYAFRDASFIGEDTLIIVEASLNTDFDWAEDAGYEILKKKIYKTNVHVFLTPKSKHEGVKES